MYIFNRITVNPQLPKRIGRLTEIANIYGGHGIQNF